MSLEVEDQRITRCHKCSDWGPRELLKHKSDRVPKTRRFAFIKSVEKSEDIDGGYKVSYLIAQRLECRPG